MNPFSAYGQSQQTLMLEVPLQFADLTGRALLSCGLHTADPAYFYALYALQGEPCLVRFLATRSDADDATHSVHYEVSQDAPMQRLDPLGSTFSSTGKTRGDLEKERFYPISPRDVFARNMEATTSDNEVPPTCLLLRETNLAHARTETTPGWRAWPYLRTGLIIGAGIAGGIAMTVFFGEKVHEFPPQQPVQEGSVAGDCHCAHDVNADHDQGNVNITINVHSEARSHVEGNEHHLHLDGIDGHHSQLPEGFHGHQDEGQPNHHQHHNESHLEQQHGHHNNDHHESHHGHHLTHHHGHHHGHPHEYRASSHELHQASPHLCLDPEGYHVLTRDMPWS